VRGFGAVGDLGADAAMETLQPSTRGILRGQDRPVSEGRRPPFGFTMKLGTRTSSARAMLIGILLAGSSCDRDFDCLQRTPEEHAHHELNLLQVALEEYADVHAGSYPTSLRELVTLDSTGQAQLLGARCDDHGDILDPWGRPYIYLAPAGRRARACAWSLGADGKRLGSGDDRDQCSLSIWDNWNEDALYDE